MVDFTSEQQFLGAPESDRLLAFGMAMATELWVTRTRLHRMEARWMRVLMMRCDPKYSPNWKGLLKA